MTRIKWTKSLSLTILGSLLCFVFPASPSAEIHGAQKGAEIPFKLYNDYLIIVKGTIGSIENVNIMLDTGKSPTAISEKIAKDLSLQGNRESMLLSNGRIDVQSVVLPRILIGAMRAESIRVVVQDLSYMERKLGISLGGIAGLDILSGHSFMIDYLKRKIVFAPAKAARKSVRFERQKPFLTVRAMVEGQEVRLLVDSGTAGLLIYRKRLTATLEPLPTNQDALISTAAGSMRTAWFHASRVSLGKENLGPQIMLVANVDPDPRYEFDGLLGFTKMGIRKVWFDFENGMLGWD